jgi:hypothetical protein
MYESASLEKARRGDSAPPAAGYCSSRELTMNWAAWVA